MSQDIERRLEFLEQRLREQGELIEELEQFQCSGQGDQVFAADLSTDSGDGVCPLTGEMARWKTFSWSGGSCHGMEYISSYLKMYSTGAVETRCVLRDASRHRKYGNHVFFYLRAEGTGATLCNLCAWGGNFSPGEQKAYTAAGSYACVKDNFDLIGSGKEFRPWRNWTCWKRN